MANVTLNKLIYNLRRIVAGGQISDDDPFPAAQWEFIINSKRALLLKEQLQKGRSITSDMTQTVTFEMITVDKNECNIELPTNCYILRTKEVVPSILQFNDLYGIKFIGLLDDTPIHFTSFAQANWNKYRKYTSKQKIAFIRNNFIYVINPQLLEFIKIDAIFTSPREAAEFQCNKDTNCFDFDSSYPLPDYLVDILNKLILDTEIRFMLNISTSDNTNDAKDNPSKK